jgi:hypothetical protein
MALKLNYGSLISAESLKSAGGQQQCVLIVDIWLSLLGIAWPRPYDEIYLIDM